ncbi:MAG: hypothetical protein K6G15_02605 [Desulfovibrio sp.]|nr:hypothetical protein [Desulfovibrio sp.]
MESGFSGKPPQSNRGGLSVERQVLELEQVQIASIVVAIKSFWLFLFQKYFRKKRAAIFAIKIVKR